MLSPKSWMGYSPVNDDEDEVTARKKLDDASIASGFCRKFIVILCLLASGTSFLYIIHRVLVKVPLRCEEPRVRREWRSLSTHDKLSYIDGIKCLQRQPSIISVDGSLYDDFSYIHHAVGYRSHETASFLPWHRYFVQIYENGLRSQCGYDGPLPYWNWVLDYEDPASSAVFDGQLGFGGNGDSVLGESPVGQGHCVTDGPFAMTTARNDTSRGHFSGNLIRPDLVDKMMAVDDLLLFTLKLESAPHNAIPAGIRGDFLSFNAPADPLFFLHHAQLDRLWWRWQHGRREGETEYRTKWSPKSSEKTSLYDKIEMGGLSSPVRVADILDTRGGFLCYVYDV